MKEAVECYQCALALNPRDKSPQYWAGTQNNLGLALQELGKHSAGEEGRKLLEDAVAAHRSALEVCTKADLPQSWAKTKNNQGLALGEIGTHSGEEESRNLLAEAGEEPAAEC